MNGLNKIYYHFIALFAVNIAIQAFGLAMFRKAIQIVSKIVIKTIPSTYKKIVFLLKLIKIILLCVVKSLQMLHSKIQTKMNPKSLLKLKQ